ncbi:NAD(P)-dependent glycerol-3-phosphate dehydrogenase [Xinfangfangia sp. D13-10-4-6]|uniref:NAD(P)H-dependent glycerol-3-phosphate dehydrogenase n=1 Tax=Pseudogemmobacter hezensis TaxID=2737662 RepID=UPI00155571E1|nr:NAD(P)H-dependent glycerol-3-phosphate dehydrogenase [Pseudogemmobacter hezensis]NPD17388.1 NAD(P)-dependent glycerol-3-phosphate dehydrogenase [Pseudogemmobacter hezensis]
MIGIAGAGAFGTALAVTLAADGRQVQLWARDAEARQQMRDSRLAPRLPGVTLPERITITENVSDLAKTGVVLLAMPMQAMRGFLAQQPELLGADLVACSKGIDLTTLQGPTEVMAAAEAQGAKAVLTGPSFAADIARGLPTALTLACDCPRAEALQHLLSTATLRLYRSDDVIGAQLGGALKNVIAIAAGLVVGAGFGESARAALITRGYAEMTRLAMALGARSETLAGLSGLGDLILTCSSGQSRNFSHGLALGQGKTAPEATVEGVATAQAATRLAREKNIDMPVTAMVARLVAGETTLGEAVRELMSRPLKQE